MQSENWISVDVGWCLVFRSCLQAHKDQFSDCSMDLASKDCSEVAAETELSLLMNIGELPSVQHQWHFPKVSPNTQMSPSKIYTRELAHLLFGCSSSGLCVTSD